jgi:hypothetical protein
MLCISHVRQILCVEITCVPTYVTVNILGCREFDGLTIKFSTSFKVSHSFTSSFLRQYEKSTLAVLEILTLPSYLRKVHLDIIVRLTLKIFQTGVCTYDFSTEVMRTFVFSSLHAPMPLQFLLP